MLSIDQTYKKLHWKVETYKIIAELRTLTFLAKAPKNELISAGSLCSFVGTFGDLTTKIESIINVIDSKLIDLNAHDDITDEFYAEVRELYSRYKNDVAKIRNLENSLLFLTLACPNSRPLSIELIEFIETVGKEFSSKELITKQIEKMLIKTPHIEDSPVTTYLSDYVHDDNWYDAYLFNSKFARKEEKETIFNSILLNIKEGRISTSRESLRMLVRKFVKNGACISYETMISLLKASAHHQDSIHDAMLEIGFNTSKYSFNLENAFEKAFRSLENDDGLIVIDEQTTKRLSGLFKYACALQGITFASLVFSNLILSHPQRDEIVDIITNWLCEYPPLLAAFNKTYLKEERKLESERKHLILILHKIESTRV